MSTLLGWDEESSQEEERRLQAMIDDGQCPWSGYSIKLCQDIDLCDCFLPSRGGTVQGALGLVMPAEPVYEYRAHFIEAPLKTREIQTEAQARAQVDALVNHHQWEVVRRLVLPTQWERYQARGDRS